MNDSDLQALTQQARRAQAKVDLSALEYGFETRLSARLARMQAGGPGILASLWRAVAGCAALAGVLAAWFILSQAPHAAEDDLTAFWNGGQASYDGEFLN